jgi:hypothetical protein
MTSPGTIEHPPQGWVYETGDDSVGIFGEGWFHDDEDCGERDYEPQQFELDHRYEGTGHGRRSIRTIELTCPCGASTVVLDDTWDPDVPDDCVECPYDPKEWAV